MTAGIRILGRGRGVRYAFVLACLGVIALGAVAFVVEPGTGTPEPVPFEDTTDTGLGGEERFALEEAGYAIPRVEVFYSQFPYVVGYRGVEYAIDDFQQLGHEQQFGYPTTVYVTDFAGRELRLSDEGYLEADGERSWIDAEEAHFVVGSEARTPATDMVIPFSERDEAEAFTSAHGGEILDWETLQSHSFDIDDATVVRDRVDGRRTAANETVADLRALAAREVGVTVGADEPTIQEAIDEVEAGKAVQVPAGTYHENLVVDKPVTIRGPNATVVGSGNGSVIDVEHDAVAVTGLSLRGVGNRTSLSEEEINGSDWDEGIEAGYGHGDAGIVAAEVTDNYVANVSIDTPTNGILFRDVDAGVVENVEIQGSEKWPEGFMGVLGMRSQLVVQNTTVDDGRDGVYLHRAHGTVIRDSTFRDNRFGVHFMYTSESLVAESRFRGQESAGIVIMTGPEKNALVGNDVRNSRVGIIPIGSRNYIAENVLAFNDLGMRTSTSTSLYERNTVYGNEIGFRTGGLRPSNRLVRNDILANDVPVESELGPLRIWSRDGEGNYWAAANARVQSGAPYSPTDPIEGTTHRVGGAVTLGASPAATILDAVRQTTPGMREGNVVDNSPREKPVRPTVIARLERDSDE